MKKFVSLGTENEVEGTIFKLGSLALEDKASPVSGVSSESPRRPLTPIQNKLGKPQHNEMGKKPTPPDLNGQKNAGTLGKVTPNSVDRSPALKKVRSGFISKKKLNREVQTESTEADIVTGDVAPLEYWKQLAEERRLALEETLKENERLAAKIEALEMENRNLEEMVEQATVLAEMINTMSEAADDSGIGREEVTLNASTFDVESEAD